MKRLGNLALFLVPLVLFALACAKGYQASLEYWPSPASPDDDHLLRRPSQILTAFVGLFAPMPLCMAVSLGLRKRRGKGDEVGDLVAELFTLVAAEMAVFFGLVAIGRVGAGAFLTAQVATAAAGVALVRYIRTQGDGGLLIGAARRYALVALALTTCALASVHMGKDIGYDFYNYHHYNAYAFLHHRGHLDFALADIATHLNPTLDVAYYLVYENVRPIWAGFVVGAAHGVGVVLLYAVALEILGRVEPLKNGRVPLALACAVAGFCEPLFLGQLGTTFHDVLLVPFVLTALWIVVRLVGNDGTGRVRVGLPAALAGASVGLAAGFKLTSATFAVAIVVALLAAAAGWRKKIGMASAFGAGTVAGFLVANGWWMATLYADYGSPLFPVYNKIFKSPFYPEQNISYLNATAGFRWFDHLLIPFRMATTGKVLNETPTSDLRPAAVYVLLILVALDRFLTLLRADWRSPARLKQALAGPLTPGAAFLIVFAVVSYVVWYAQFRILRYLVALKVVLPLVCVLLLFDLCRSRRRVWVASALTLALLTVSFDVPNWGRGRWKKHDYLGYTVPKLDAEPGGIVLFNTTQENGGFLNAFNALVPKLPADMRYVRIDSVQVMNPFGGKPLAMQQQVLTLLREHKGPVYLLTHDDPAALSFSSKLLTRYDLELVPGQTPKKIDGGQYAQLVYWRLERHGAGLASGTGTNVRR